MRWPVVYMIGGPNGAGKTTAAMGLMPSAIDCVEYVNADAIAAGLSPFRPAGVTIEAGRVMLKRIAELARARRDFAFETTMASRSFMPFLRQCRVRGYRIEALYIWLRSADLAVERVAQRVSEGGHAVAEATVRSRYLKGLANFRALYAPMADLWTLYDNSGPKPRLVARGVQGRPPEVLEPDLWRSIEEMGPWHREP